MQRLKLLGLILLPSMCLAGGLKVAPGPAAAEFSRLAATGVNTAAAKSYPVKAKCLAIPESLFSQDAQLALASNLSLSQLKSVDEFYATPIGTKLTNDTIKSKTTGTGEQFSDYEKTQILKVIALPGYAKAQDAFNNRLKVKVAEVWAAKRKQCL